MGHAVKIDRYCLVNRVIFLAVFFFLFRYGDSLKDKNTRFMMATSPFTQISGPMNLTAAEAIPSFD